MCKPMHHLTTSSDELYIPEETVIQNIPTETSEGSDDKSDSSTCLEKSTLIGKWIFLTLIIILIVMIIWLPWFYFEFRRQGVQMEELHERILGELGRRQIHETLELPN